MWYESKCVVPESESWFSSNNIVVVRNTANEVKISSEKYWCENFAAQLSCCAYAQVNILFVKILSSTFNVFLFAFLCAESRNDDGVSHSRQMRIFRFLFLQTRFSPSFSLFLALLIFHTSSDRQQHIFDVRNASMDYWRLCMRVSFCGTFTFRNCGGMLVMLNAQTEMWRAFAVHMTRFWYEFELSAMCLCLWGFMIQIATYPRDICGCMWDGKLLNLESFFFSSNFEIEFYCFWNWISLVKFFVIVFLWTFASLIYLSS